MTRTSAIGLLLLGAFGISFSPILVKMLGHNIIGPTSIAFWRILIGGAVLFLLALLQGKSLKLPLRTMLWCVFAGFFFFLDLSLWHRSILYVGAGMATILGHTQIFSSSILSVLIFKEKLTIRFMIAAIAALSGISLLVGVLSEDVHFSGSYLRGVIFGILTGLMYAMYIVGIKKAGEGRKESRKPEEKPEPIVVVAWLCVFSAIFNGIGAQLEEGAFMPPDLRSFLLLAALGIGVQALSWWIIASALRETEIHLTSLILLLQPVLAMIWGMLLFNEVLAVEQLIGAAITLTAIYFGSTGVIKTAQLKPQKKKYKI